MKWVIRAASFVAVVAMVAWGCDLYCIGQGWRSTLPVVVSQPTLLFVLGFTAAGLCLTHGPKLSLAAVLAPFGYRVRPECLPRLCDVMESGRRLALCGGWFCFGIGSCRALTVLDKPSSIGPFFCQALLGMVGGVLLAELGFGVGRHWVQDRLPPAAT